MPTYLYEAKDASGRDVIDQIEAASEADARGRLQANGCSVTRLQMVGIASGWGRGGLPPRTFWWIWSLGFLIVGGLFLYVLGVRPLWGVLRSSGWVQTPCTVVLSGLQENKDSEGGGGTYRINIKYNYEFRGGSYSSDRYDFLGLFSNTNMAEKSRIVKAHPPGSRTVCYVDPAKPTEAVLYRGWNSEMCWGLFPVPFVLLGACGLVFGALGWRPRHKPVPHSDQR